MSIYLLKTNSYLTEAIKNYVKLFPTEIEDHEKVFYFSKFVQMRTLFADEPRTEEAKMGEKGKRSERKADVSDH